MSEKELEIVNKTVYNTDDFRDFYRKAVGDGYISFRKVVLGYYTPTPEDKLVDPANKSKPHVKPSPFNFVNYKRRKKNSWKGTPRVGIVKPMKLFTSPLEALASAADEDGLVPLAAKCELAQAIAAYHYQWYEHNDPVTPMSLETLTHHRDQFGWVKDFKLRFRQSGRRRKTPEQKLAELETKMSRLSWRYSDASSARRTHEKNLEKAEERERELGEEYCKLSRKIDDFKRKHDLD